MRVEETAGLSAPLGRCGYHLRQGRLYTLWVQPQPPDEIDGAATKVTVEGGELLPLALPLQIAAGADAGTVHCFRPRLGWILPARTQLTVILASTGAAVLNLTLPVLIWPSFWRQCAWAVGLFFTVVSTRYLALIQWREGTPLECLARVATDLSYLIEAAAVGVGLLLCLRAGGLLWLAWGELKE
jgi:hypothetical protein